MLADNDVLELGTDGPIAPPRSNGELTFNAPWESRSFAMALSLADQGFFTLDEFRESLISAISAWESKSSEEDEYHYYERWHEALESIVQRSELIAESAIGDRTARLADRPAGHDHAHGHSH